MNMQTIQIMILLLDSFIKLAPWRIVTETLDRIGCGASESLARSLVVIVAACAGLCTLPAASIFRALQFAVQRCRFRPHGSSRRLIAVKKQVFMNLDKMIGGDFEAGLADLKKLNEN